MNREDWSEKNVAQKGFTLIELLVVIAILGILAVVGVLAFGGLTDSAKTATKNTETSQVQTAVDAYLAKDSANTVAGIDGGSATGGPVDAAALKTAGVLKTSATLQQNYNVDANGDVTVAP